MRPGSLRHLRRVGSCSPLALVALWSSTTHAFAADEVVDELVGLAILLPFLLGAYFVPSIVAFAREHPNRWAILVVNFAFGITILGWIGSLIWALDVIHRSAGGGYSGA